MANDPRVLGLLEEMLSSCKTPEEVCRHCPARRSTSDSSSGT
jgi:hypothetical protein